MTVARRGYKETSSGGTTAASSIVLDPSSPTGGSAPVVGDWLVVGVGANTPSGNAFSPPAGWDEIQPGWGVIGTMLTKFYRRERQAGDTSYTFTLSGTARHLDAFMCWFSGANAPTVVGTPKARTDSPTESVTCTAPALTTPVNDSFVLSLSNERTTASETDAQVSVTGSTKWFFHAQAGSCIISFCAATETISTAGTSGDTTFTYPNTQSINGWAFQIAFPPAPEVAADLPLAIAFSAAVVEVQPVTADLPLTVAFTAAVSVGTGGPTAVTADLPLSVAFSAAVVEVEIRAASLPLTVAFTAAIVQVGGVAANLGLTVTFSAAVAHQHANINAFWAAAPFYVAHRGGGGNWPQFSLYAYAQSVSWGARALEVSTWRSLDGYWVACHDYNLAVETGSAQTPVYNRNWVGDLENVMITDNTTDDPAQGDQPLALLTDILDLYAGSHIIYVESKSGNDTDAANLITLFATHANARDHIVWKTPWDLGPNGAQAAYDAGFYTWIYGYEAGITGLVATRAKASSFGMDYAASSGAWTTLLAEGKPTAGHIITSSAQATTALGKGANGLMVSNVEQVIPQTGAQVAANLALTATFSAVVVEVQPTAANLALSVTFAATVVEVQPVTGNLPLAIALTAAVVEREFVTAALPLTITLSAAVAEREATLADLPLTITFSASVVPAQSVTATLALLLVLAAVVSIADAAEPDLNPVTVTAVALKTRATVRPANNAATVRPPPTRVTSREN